MLKIDQFLLDKMVCISFLDGSELVCHLEKKGYSDENSFINVISPFELKKYLQKRFAVHYEKGDRLTMFEKYIIQKNKSDILKIDSANSIQINSLIRKLLSSLD